ncbi:hypothetical protein ACRALDRAFT_1064499 [Sodiomyces alcalophilus JCM 7366]|uniref:uncharacterized protein n=1 Tax=Sodiomyces alcalophilus JCM 7366 TaxID=591952 RepID=UPI0039B3CD1D
MAQSPSSLAISVPFSSESMNLTKFSHSPTIAALSSPLPYSPRKKNPGSATFQSLPARESPVLADFDVSCAAQAIYSPPAPAPPPTTGAWTWTCHRCGVKYRLSCTQRCFECSRARKREGKNPKPKPSEFDFAGWRDFNKWRGEVAVLKSLPASSSSASSPLSSSSSDTTTDTYAAGTGCEFACDFPGECQRRRAHEEARRRRAMEEEQERKQKQEQEQKEKEKQEQEDDRWWNEIQAGDGPASEGLEGYVLSRVAPFGQLADKDGEGLPSLGAVLEEGDALGDTNMARMEEDKHAQVRQVVLSLTWPSPSFTLSPPSSSASSSCSETWYDDERDDGDYAACDLGLFENENLRQAQADQGAGVYGPLRPGKGGDVDMDDSPRAELDLALAKTGEAGFRDVVNPRSPDPMSLLLGVGEGPARDAEMGLDAWLNTIEDPGQGHGMMDSDEDMF